MIKKAQLLTLLLTITGLSLFCSCNNADDVQQIFTGKTWRLTYITKANGHAWYKFPDVTTANYESYDPINGTRAFYITFSGSTSNDVINGTFAGTGSVNINGKWEADGKSNRLLMNVGGVSVVDPTNDHLGNRIAEGLKKVTSYGGNTQNLYLYYKLDETNETLCLVFAPAKKIQ